MENSTVNQGNFSRRVFLAASGASAALLSSPVLAATSGGTSPNGRLRIGFIGVGGRCQTHVDSSIRVQNEKGTVECAAVCDVFNRYVDGTADKIKQKTGKAPTKHSDYRDIINDPSIDAVVIATPDHWHAKQTIDALKAGKHVYCEKPMTHTVDEAIDVYRTWQDSGKVMQVGVQSTALPVWKRINEDIRSGKLGKIMQYQTEYYRNSSMGQWRYYPLSKDMTPKNIDWKSFLGTEFDLAPDQPFDRARFAQWRCYWDFGSGLYTDLFVHRTTSMLTATGLRFPGRVVGAGGIFLELDGREAPDVATIAADFNEGVQGVATSTMCAGETPIQQLIRGHNGSAVLGIGEEFKGYDFVAERPQVTRNSKLKSERVEVGGPDDTSYSHFENFLASVKADDPSMVNCSPEVGAAAMVIVKLGAKSYREGKVFHFDPSSLTVSEGDASWANKWEQMSYNRSKPAQTPGWKGGDTGSVLFPEPYQSLEGPWKDGVDPAGA
jgi:predicted dehydrogenase